jgi:glutaredoxin
MKLVVIYSRPGCHLCEEAKKIMKSAGCDGEYVLQEIDIETDANLQERYRYDIPVITVDGQKAFKHRLTAKAFRERILRAT